MKVTMNRDGLITIWPENAVEAYALRHWAEGALVRVEDVKLGESAYWRGSRLMVVPDGEFDE